jgi:hypothetical protein
MPIVRYFVFVGTALLALLFVIDTSFPKLPAADHVNTAANVASFGDPNSLHSKVAGAGGVRYQLADGYACIEQDRRGKYSCGGRFHDGSHTRYLRAIANDTSANARPANNRTQKAGAEARAQTQGRCEQDEGPHGSASYSGGATTALWIVPEYDLVGGSRAGHGALTFPWLFSSRGKYPSAWC